MYAVSHIHLYTYARVYVYTYIKLLGIVVQKIQTFFFFLCILSYIHIIHTYIWIRNETKESLIFCYLQILAQMEIFKLIY